MFREHPRAHHRSLRWTTPPRLSPVLSAPIRTSDQSQLSLRFRYGSPPSSLCSPLYRTIQVQSSGRHAQVSFFNTLFPGFCLVRSAHASLPGTSGFIPHDITPTSTFFHIQVWYDAYGTGKYATILILFTPHTHGGKQQRNIQKSFSFGLLYDADRPKTTPPTRRGAGDVGRSAVKTHTVSKKKTSQGREEQLHGGDASRPRPRAFNSSGEGRFVCRGKVEGLRRSTPAQRAEKIPGRDTCFARCLPVQNKTPVFWTRGFLKSKKS